MKFPLLRMRSSSVLRTKDEIHLLDTKQTFIIIRIKNIHMVKTKLPQREIQISSTKYKPSSFSW